MPREEKTRLVPWPSPKRRNNPYLKLLYSAMALKGIEVCRPPFRFSALASRRKGFADWLHIHWPGWLTRARTLTDLKDKQRRVLEVIETVKTNGISLLWTLHNLIPHDSPFIEAETEFRKELAAMCDLIHVHFQSANDAIRKHFGYTGEIITVPHGSYLGHYPPAIPQDLARLRLGLPKKAKVFINLGIMKPYKALEVCIQAISILRDPDTYLIICGKPGSRAYANELRKMTNSRTLLIPRKIPDRQLPTYLCAADAFVISHRRFFTSGSALLALSYGLPLIGPPVNHLEELSSEPFFTPWREENPYNLAWAMQKALSSDIQSNKQAAIRYAEDHCWDSIISPLVQHIQRKSPVVSSRHS